MEASSGALYYEGAAAADAPSFRRTRKVYGEFEQIARNVAPYLR
jgi:hypothetical protein